MAFRKGGHTSANKPGNITVKGVGIEDLVASLLELADAQVLVGFPEDGEARQDAKEPTNAQLAYIHDNGAPEANIPARPFMVPGLEEAKDKVADKLVQTLKAVLREGVGGDGMAKARQGLEQVGFIAANSVKRAINAGVPPPLSDYTLRARMKSGRKDGGGARKGAAQELDRRWDGQEPSVEFAKPLVDTGQMRNNVTYVVRSRKKG